MQMALSDLPRKWVNSSAQRAIEGKNTAYGLYGRENPVIRQEVRFSLEGKLIESLVELSDWVQLRNEFGKRCEIGFQTGHVNDCAIVESTTQRELSGGRKCRVIYSVIESFRVQTRDESDEDC